MVQFNLNRDHFFWLDQDSAVWSRGGFTPAILVRIKLKSPKVCTKQGRCERALKTVTSSSPVMPWCSLVFEAVRAWQKRGTENEFRGLKQISVGGLGSGEKRGNWMSTALWSDTAKSAKFTSSTRNHRRAPGQVYVPCNGWNAWHFG